MLLINVFLNIFILRMTASYLSNLFFLSFKWWWLDILAWKSNWFGIQILTWGRGWNSFLFIIYHICIWFFGLNSFIWCGWLVLKTGWFRFILFPLNYIKVRNFLILKGRCLSFNIWLGLSSFRLRFLNELPHFYIARIQRGRRRKRSLTVGIIYAFLVACWRLGTIAWFSPL